MRRPRARGRRRCAEAVAATKIPLALANLPEIIVQAAGSTRHGCTILVPAETRRGDDRSQQMTPLEKVEGLYDELVDWYGEGANREIRAASKLLMVALLKLKEHGGFGWQELVEEYLLMLRNNPERYQSMLDANRGERKEEIR